MPMAHGLMFVAWALVTPQGKADCQVTWSKYTDIAYGLEVTWLDGLIDGFTCLLCFSSALSGSSWLLRCTWCWTRGLVGPISAAYIDFGLKPKCNEAVEAVGERLTAQCVKKELSRALFAYLKMYESMLSKVPSNTGKCLSVACFICSIFPSFAEYRVLFVYSQSFSGRGSHTSCECLAPADLEQFQEWAWETWREPLNILTCADSLCWIRYRMHECYAAMSYLFFCVFFISRRKLWSLIDLDMPQIDTA